MTPQEHAAAVLRFDMCYDNRVWGMTPKPDGMYVLYTEYRETLDRLAVAEAQLNDAQSALRYIFDQYGPLNGVGWDRVYVPLEQQRGQVGT